MSIEIKNAVIESAVISTAERGFLDCSLSLDYGGTGQAGTVKPWAYDLWKHLHDEHGLTLLGSEMAEIVRLAQLAQPVSGTQSAEGKQSTSAGCCYFVIPTLQRDIWYGYPDKPESAELAAFVAQRHKHISPLFDAEYFAAALNEKDNRWHAEARILEVCQQLAAAEQLNVKLAEALKELFAAAKGTVVCHGQGDYGDSLTYQPELRAKAEQALARHDAMLSARKQPEATL